MATTRQQVGSTTYTVRWEGAKLSATVRNAARETMQGLRSDVDSWLHTNLHRWTGEMEAMAFAEYEEKGDELTVSGGSDSPHTFWHEVRWHPQLRACLDIHAPQMGPRLKAKLG